MLIIQVSVVLRKIVGGSDWRFDSLGSGHLQSQKSQTIYFITLFAALNTGIKDFAVFVRLLSQISF